MPHCSEPSCGSEASLRCSKCKSVYYCSESHQRQHWKVHKLCCGKALTEDHSSQSEVPSSSHQWSGALTDNPPNSSGGSPLAPSTSTEQRSCRCMFCGENLILSSEDEAVDHMRVCPALQEQLLSKDQFTVPSMIK
eukprot:gene24738-gene21409